MHLFPIVILLATFSSISALETTTNPVFYAHGKSFRQHSPNDDAKWSELMLLKDLTKLCESDLKEEAIWRRDEGELEWKRDTYLTHLETINNILYVFNAETMIEHKKAFTCFSTLIGLTFTSVRKPDTLVSILENCEWKYAPAIQTLENRVVEWAKSKRHTLKYLKAARLYWSTSIEQSLKFVSALLESESKAEAKNTIAIIKKKLDALLARVDKIEGKLY